VTLCDGLGNVLGGTWSAEGKIVLGSTNGLVLVSAVGGSTTNLTNGGGALVLPSFLPDGHHFLYLDGARPDVAGIYIGDVNTMRQGQPLKKLLGDFSMAVYAPSGDSGTGYLLFVRGTSAAGNTGALMAQPFDTQRLELTGEAIPIAEKISNVEFSVSTGDVLAYTRGSQGVTSGGARGIVQGQLTWFDRQGKVLGAIGDPGSYRTLTLSPDGKRVAFDRADAQNPNVRNIWLFEFARGVTTRFTFDSDTDYDPVWSPDGSRIAFASGRDGPFDLYTKTSNLAGEDELLLKVPENVVPSSWSPDGRFLLYFNPVPPTRQWLLPLSGDAANRKPFRVDNSEFAEGGGRISPDGRWVAFASDESGRMEVYVRPLPTSSGGPSSAGGTPITGKWMVSKDGGTTPLWRADGKELFYLSAVGGTAMAVDVNTSGVFQAGIPKPLFKIPTGVLFWDVSKDGQRFLMPAPASANTATQPPFTIVLNWQSLLKR